jgi:hypothetical protein
MKPRLQIAAAELQCGLDLRVLGDTDAPGCREVCATDGHHDGHGRGQAQGGQEVIGEPVGEIG